MPPAKNTDKDSTPTPTRRKISACEKCGVDITVLNLRTELPPIYRRFGYVESGIEEFHPNQPLKPGVECHCIVMSKAL